METVARNMDTVEAHRHTAQQAVMQGLEHAPSSVAASPTKITVSPDGSCGKSVAHTCVGSRFGLCCSAGGKCGNLVLSLQQTYCGVGCQAAYGLCL